MSLKRPKKLILASASPRRRKLLKHLGLTFKVMPSNCNETVDPDTSPDEAVKILALRKAQNIANQTTEPALVIGSDTTVVINNKSLGKPIDNKDACRMLKLLSGTTHEVISGLAVIDTTTKVEIVDSVSSKVLFKELTEEEINDYIQTREPIDKAGAYAIQGLASTFIEKIDGCYNNIVGLPIFRLSEILKDFNINILKLHVKE